jgi:hypothetical protein
MPVYTTWPGGVGAFVPFPPLMGSGKKTRRNKRKTRKTSRKSGRKSRRSHRK